MCKKEKPFFTQRPLENVDDETEIKYIEKEILKHFRIKNFQSYWQRVGLNGYCKQLSNTIKKLVKFFMYYNTLLDAQEEKEEKGHEQAVPGEHQIEDT